MNKKEKSYSNIEDKLIEFAKAFTGIFIYFFINILASRIITRINPDSNIRIILVLVVDFIILASLITVYRKRLKKDFIDFDKNYKNYLAIGLKAWAIGMIFMMISNAFIYNFVTTSSSFNQNANEMIISKYPIYAVISIIMFGPFMEELVFRLPFKEHIKNKYLYFFLTILIFAGIHVVNGITSYQELLFFLPYGALATALSYGLYKTNNIFTTVIIHTMHNSMAIIMIILSMILGA